MNVLNAHRRLVVLTIALGLLPGCGGSDLPLVPVRGRVTFDGGPCPLPGKISFVPVRDSGVSGLPHRPGWAQFDADGQFAATSFTPGDGLLPGRYQVRLSCLDAPPDASDPNWQEKHDRVPQDYRPAELLVEPGQPPIVLDYDVPPKAK